MYSQLKWESTKRQLLVRLDVAGWSENKCAQDRGGGKPVLCPIGVTRKRKEIVRLTAALKTGALPCGACRLQLTRSDVNDPRHLQSALFIWTSIGNRPFSSAFIYLYRFQCIPAAFRWKASRTWIHEERRHRNLSWHTGSPQMEMIPKDWTCIVL